MSGAGRSNSFLMTSKVRGSGILPAGHAPCRSGFPARTAVSLGTAMAATLAGLMLADRANADVVDACGEIADDGSVICDASGNPYADGITYQATAADPGDPASEPLNLDVLLRSGVAVMLPPAGTATAAVDLSAAGDASVALTGEAGSSLSTQGSNQYGVRTIADRGDVTVRMGGSVESVGASSIGIFARSNGGEVNVEAADVSGTGSGTSAIRVQRSGSADVTVDAGSVAVSGDGAIGILVQGGQAGLITLTADSVTANGAGVLGLGAYGTDSDVSIVADTINVTGANSSGVALQTGGAADITITNAINVGSGEFAAAISASTAGDIDLSLASMTSNAVARGVTLQSTGSINATVGEVTIEAPVTVSLFAMQVDARGEEANVELTGTMKSNVGGIAVSGKNANVKVRDMMLSGDSNSAIIINGHQSNVTIDGTIVDSTIRGNDLSTPLNSTFAVTAGDLREDLDDGSATIARVENNGAIQALLEKSTGLLIISDGDAVVTGAGTIFAQGYESGGLRIYSRDNVSVEHGSISTTGGFAPALKITDADLVTDDPFNLMLDSFGPIGGDLSIDVAALSTQGDASNAFEAVVGGASDIRVGSITTSGFLSNGVALTGTGDIDLAVDDITITGAGRSYGVQIFAYGNLAMDLGKVSSVNRAVSVSAQGNISLIGRDISTSGANAPGVFALGDGDIAVDIDSITTLGNNSAAIRASGDTIDISARNISTAGAGAHGILAQANGDVTILAGNISTSGANANAINASSAAGSVSIEIGTGGNLAAAIADTVVFGTVNGGTLTNAGTIVGDGGAAVRASGAPVAIFNSGTLSGDLLLTDGADSISNSGLLRLTGGTVLGGGDQLSNNGLLILAGDIDFGSEDSGFTNSGTIRLEPAPAAAMTPSSGVVAQAISAPANETVQRSIIGLENLANSGTIDLANGVAGDTLSLSGGLVGTGASRISLDIAFGSAITADRLIVDGAATGSTRVGFKSIGTPQLGRSDAVVIETGAGSAAGAFATDPLASSFGLFAGDLVFDPAASSYSVAIVPSVSAYRLLNVSEGAQSLWLETADSVASHFDNRRRSGASASGFWANATGTVAKRDDVQTLAALGATQTADLGYDQDMFGGQLGFDIGGNGLSFGPTGGYASSTMNFSDSADRVSFDAWNIGAYAIFNSDRFFANGLLKYDIYNIDATLGGGGPKASTDGSGYGVRAEAGVRLGSWRFYAEPVVSLSWQHIDIDPLDLPLAVEFEDREGGRGAAGIRLGHTSQLGEGALLNLYAQGDYVQPFGSEAKAVFSSGNISLAFEDRRIGAHGKGKIGVSVTTGAVTGFIEAQARASDDYRGGGGRAGLQIVF